MTHLNSSYIIFFNETAIHFTDQNQNDDSQSVFIRSRSDMQRFLDRFLNSPFKNDIILSGKNIHELFENFKACFKFIEAAGGLAKNDKGEYLLIKRFGIWDLPKGKLENDELAKTGALREVSEETGVQELKILKELPSTYHIYARHKKNILKKTHWFLMETSFEGPLKAQIREDITEAIWMDRENSVIALKESYRSIRDILIPCI